MSNWAAATAPDGRTYYYNKETKATQWTKPDDLDTVVTTPSTPAVPSSGSQEWSEATAPDGRKYYYNKITRETSWQVPPGFQQQQRSAAVQQVGRGGGPSFVAGSSQQPANSEWGGSDHRSDRRDDRGHGLPQKPSFDGPRNGGMPWEQRQDNTGFRGPMPAKTDEPEYPTAEAAEEAFFKLLKQHNIGSDSTWEDALRDVIKDREYRAIKDPHERKKAFEKYCLEVRAQEKGKEKERKEKLREDFRKMLATHDEIKHFTRWKTARPMIEREAVFKSAGDDEERRRMYDEYLLELKRKTLENEVNLRKVAKQDLEAMLKALILDPDVAWDDAEKLIGANEKFASEDIFRFLHRSDILVAYQNHTRALERVANDTKQEEKRLRARRERSARDGYKQLLLERQRQGDIKAGTKWQDFHANVANDERYLTYLGNLGSTAMELFWDIVEDEERTLRSKRNDALDVLEEKRYEMTIETTLEQFSTVMRSHPLTEQLGNEELGMIFDRLMDKIKRRAEDEKLDAERSQKAAVDLLRSAMKRLDPPIRADDSFEQVMQQLVGHRDYESADNDVRKSAYEKYMRRLKEREQYDRERDRDRTRRDRDRDHDREYRNGSRRDQDRDRDRRRRTRTPEVDAYEADRRKAQADRERQYRKASFGLTPPARDRRDDHLDRERRHDRNDGVSHYDRERREREVERERSYLSRADPRDKGRTLDYGDEDTVGSRPGSIRKRRDSDGSVDSRRENKRSRHERQDRTRTPEIKPEQKDEQPELQSGSEEGEIEEV